jgi:flagellin
MIGGLSSSLALAQRTATKARATMDTMARQIATGQKVSSVKDDGAAWARASAMRSQLKGNEALRTNFGYMRSVFEINRAGAEAKLDDVANRVSTAVQASDPSLSPGARSQIQLLHDAHAGGPTASIAFASHGQRGDTGAGFTFNNLDAVNILTVLTQQDGSGQTYAGGSGGITIPAGDIADVSTAAAAQLAVAALNAEGDRQRWRLQYWAGVGNSLDRFDSHLAVEADRLNIAIGSLTDADLGEASAARAQADTRQQLALQTIQQALSAYGNFAGGLLGNVQRTQRGVLA